MTNDALLVGSIPMHTAEEVFRLFGGTLGPDLAYLPDGEIGDRQLWIDAIAYRVFNGHPEIETLKRPAPDPGGVERWRARNRADQFEFRVKPGVTRVQFGDAGWRLGYTRDAITSYSIFRLLKREGAIPAHLRFQVCLPLTWSAVMPFFPDRDDFRKVMPGFTAALRAEIAQMVQLIPNNELAIQWDLAIENMFVESNLPAHPEEAKRQLVDLVAPLEDVCAAIPSEVHLGFHVCFGTVNGWPSRQPASILGSVLLSNAVVNAAGRRVDFIHVPTVGSVDDAFFEPLRDLRVGDAKMFMGLIHHLHARDGMRGQMKSIGKFLPSFGVAAPCGLGRVPERPGRMLGETTDVVPNYLDVILADHKAAIAMLRS